MTDSLDEFAYLLEEAREVGAAGTALPVRRVEVPTDGGRVSSLLWGERPALTLLHGAGLNAHTWDATLLALGRPALALDLPGHGDSEWRDDFDYSPEQNAVAAARVIEDQAAGIRQIIVGQSLGGLTALALAAQRTALVRAVVLVDVTPGLRFEEAAQVRDFLSGPLVFASRDQIVDAAVSAGIGSDRRKLERGVVLNTRVRDDGSVVFKHHLAAPPEGKELAHDFTALWEDVEQGGFPVLLIRGSDGFLSPERVDEFRRRVPRAELLEIPAGHNVQEQQPAALAAAIDGFLARHQ
ncbi:alpha/beta fold hydrolase [Gryllotalpicola reticulitermitis]|uniref:Alpha/beta fold hydrolase n=1 Tax=Gryllotalpicola reticulitermitis TaxID=1184153 RepID=A0ABV8QCY4_9MICO